jgi:hypothetical protein
MSESFQLWSPRAFDMPEDVVVTVDRSISRADASSAGKAILE